MNDVTQLDKDRAYASQCYDKIRLQCPICLQNKIKRHCKVFKNPASLWIHLKREHENFDFRYISLDNIKRVLNHIVIAKNWGLLTNE